MYERIAQYPHQSLWPVEWHESVYAIYLPSTEIRRPLPSAPIEALKFFRVTITPVASETDDELYFGLWVEVGTGDERDRLRLIFGTERTGDRLLLRTYSKAEYPPQVSRIQFWRYEFWQKLDPKDDEVRIASTRTIGANNILNNNDRGGRGYQSPWNVSVGIDGRGCIIITPADAHPTHPFAPPLLV